MDKARKDDARPPCVVGEFTIERTAQEFICEWMLRGYQLSQFSAYGQDAEVCGVWVVMTRDLTENERARLGRELMDMRRGQS